MGIQSRKLPGKVLDATGAPKMSELEAGFAEYLESLRLTGEAVPGIGRVRSWAFEPKTLDLRGLGSYTPDFVVDRESLSYGWWVRLTPLCVEVKGCKLDRRCKVERVLRPYYIDGGDRIRLLWAYSLHRVGYDFVIAMRDPRDGRWTIQDVSSEENDER